MGAIRFNRDEEEDILNPNSLQHCTENFHYLTQVLRAPAPEDRFFVDLSLRPQLAPLLPESSVHIIRVCSSFKPCLVLNLMHGKCAEKNARMEVVET